ncbi:MAG: O-antigen ligase family protein [Ginsengibacter sp.]
MKIKITKNDFYLIGIHVLIGIVAVVFPLLISIIIVSAVLFYVLSYASRDESKLNALIFISYLTALETLYRATGVSFLPYETSKYLQVGLILVNLLFTRSKLKSYVGIVIILLLFPSSILFPSDTYSSFVFSTLGMVVLGLFTSFTAYQKIAFADFVKISKAFLLPCISFITLITIKTPKLSEIEFTLRANSETTGGFGSNQVATLLSAGICLIIILIDKKEYIGNRMITLGLMIYFFLRTFLSFSRGGVVGLFLSIFLSYALYKKVKRSVLVKFGFGMVLLVTIFVITNNITGGKLLLRYEGETAGTLAGSKKKDIKTISSGRTDYASVDLYIWLDNPLFGVGPGHSQFIRYKYGMFTEGAAHSEATRLLAENGIFGLFINFILLLWPVYIIYKTRNRDIKFIKTMLFAFAYATTFHSAMRTGISPLFYALASMNLTFENLEKKNKIAEQQSNNLAAPGLPMLS